MKPSDLTGAAPEIALVPGPVPELSRLNNNSSVRNDVTYEPLQPDDQASPDLNVLKAETAIPEALIERYIRFIREPATVAREYIDFIESVTTIFKMTTNVRSYHVVDSDDLTGVKCGDIIQPSSFVITDEKATLIKTISRSLDQMIASAGNLSKVEEA